VSPPTAEQQLQFLTNLQRLLSEGQFVATYKYALLLALADMAVERGDDTGNPLTISTKLIAEKFIQYYWRQVVPYVPKVDPSAGVVLRQNTGRQAAIIRQVFIARKSHGDSVGKVRRHKHVWRVLVEGVDHVVRQMPLWKLQTVGQSSFDFLYENVGKGTTIQLRPGVAYCFRQFYGLICDLVRGAWVRYVRRNNRDAMGTTADLSEFLFGSERSDLSIVRRILEDVQSGRCFYCKKEMRQPGHVDHFVPWSKYPVDLGHNFVAAHQACNAAKADHLAAADYLASWAERNRQHREQLAAEFDRSGVFHDLPTSLRIANWVYTQAYEASGLTWVQKNTMVALPREWRKPLAEILDA